jgi:hypothetical protein
MNTSDARVQDPLALDEIELYGEVVIAASASDHPLTTDELDTVLGVCTRASHASCQSGRGRPEIQRAAS